MAVNGAADEKITHNQQRAIIALLRTRTVAEAAAEANVAQRTLERWLSESRDFVSAYRATRNRVVANAISRLQEATDEAVECLKRNMTSATPSVQVRAASIVLEHAVKAVELYDLNERLDQLQSYIEEDGSGYR
jgi:hypothetical protein